MRTTRTRRSRWLASVRGPVAAMLAAALVLAACGGDDGEDDAADDADAAADAADEPEDEAGDDDADDTDDGGEEAATDGEVVEIRFSWWGSDERHRITQEAIAAFEEQNPDIRVVPEFADFDGYFDRIATSVAAGDGPDVITMGGAYPREYGDRGAILDLEEYADLLNLASLDESALQSGRFDGVQYGIPTGVNTHSIVINPALFEEAGVDLPDEDSWTWDDYARIAEEIAANTDDGVFGTADPTAADVIDLYARQRGESLYTDNGQVGVSTDTMEEWWTMTTALRDSGAAPSASLTSELAGQSAPEQTLIGRNLAAMEFDWSSRLVALREASGSDLQMVRAPGETAHEGAGQWFQASQLYTINAASEHPDAAARLIDFLVNSPDAAAHIGTDRGISANAEVRASIEDQLSEHQQVEVDYVGRMGDLAGPALIVGPTGSTETPFVLERLNDEVLFDRISVADAAQRFVDEVTAEIS